MKASKTRLEKYGHPRGDDVYAAKIVAIQTFNQGPTGSMTLSFDGGKQAHVHGKWFEENSPVVDGYFVAEDTADGKGTAVFVDKDKFKKYLKKD